MNDLAKLKLTLFSRILGNSLENRERVKFLDEPLKILGNFRECYEVASFLKNSQEILGVIEIYSTPENSWETFRTERFRK